jgi:hypothetical protein
MTERIFLEEVSNPYGVNALGNAKAWEVRHLRNDPSIPPLIYVVENEVGQRLLLGMDPKKENWGAWTVDVQEERFKKKAFDFNSALFEHFKEIWKEEKLL